MARDGRGEILRQAAALFARVGYRGTSMRHIAASVHMRPGSLYSHFESKAAILLDLMDGYFADVLSRQRAVMTLDAPVAVRLEKMVREVAEVVAARPETAMVLDLDWHEIVAMPEMASVVRDTRETNDLFRALLDEGVHNGELRKDIDVEALARVWGVGMTSLVDRRFPLRSPGREGREGFNADEIARCMSGLLLYGICEPRCEPSRSETPAE